MSPEAIRPGPLYMQIAAHCKQMIMSGEIRPGQQLPSVRDIARQWNVGQNTAQLALGYLKTEGLVRTAPDGTFAISTRVKYGPQQQSQATEYPENERVEIRAAELIPVPEYIVPIFGLEPGELVIRRELLTFEWDDGHIPYKLSVSWCPSWARHTVPELLDLLPLPNPAGAAAMIADRTGREITGGKEAEEVRWARNDGREGPLLYPDATAWGRIILAKVVLWWAGDTMLAYEEHCYTRGKVIETDLRP